MDLTAPLTPLGVGLDPRAEVFLRGDLVFRAIRPGFEEQTSALLREPIIQQLMERGLLIQTRVSEEKIEGFPLVLEHPRIAPITLPFEWPARMFQRAAAAILELNAALMPHGFCTVDGHPWNVLFDGTTPRFIDFTSIVPLPAHGRWEEALEFYRTCRSALQLMEKGYPTVARQLLREVREGPDPALANAILINSKRRERLPAGLREMRKAGDLLAHFTRKITRRLSTGGTAAGTLPQVEALLREVQALDLSPGQEMWSDYYDGRADVGRYDGTRASLDALRAHSPKHQAIDALLDRLRPATVLDIACNRGPYSQLAALKGARVVGIDTDEAALDAMDADSLALGTRAIPLYVNAVAPAEAIGLHGRPYPSVVERLRAECVLCLALVHHLVFKQHRISFSQVASLLSAYAEKHVIVEFVPVEDRALGDYLATRPAEFRARYAWYTLENFQAAMAAHFPRIERHESHPHGRTLLLCLRDV